MIRIVFSVTNTEYYYNVFSDRITNTNWLGGRVDSVHIVVRKSQVWTPAGAKPKVLTFVLIVASLDALTG